MRPSSAVAPGVAAIVLLVGCGGGDRIGRQPDPTPVTPPSTTVRPDDDVDPGRATTSPTAVPVATSTSATTSTEPPSSRLQTLTEGSFGPAVVTLQRMLNHVLGTELRPDGIFGPDTALAVAAFQEQYGLPVTGDADHETRHALADLDDGRSTMLPDWPVPDLGSGGADGCQVVVVGDSLVAGAHPVHEAALEAIGCAAAVDGVGSRSLIGGWQCWVDRFTASARLEIVERPEPGNETCAPAGLELLRLWAEADALGDVVVVALGTNDAGVLDEARWIDRWQRALDLTAPRPVVFLTTAAAPGSDHGPAQQAYSAALRAWCDRETRCRLADWALGDVASDPASYVDDVHLTVRATAERARFIARSVEGLLSGTPAPDPAPVPTPTTTLPSPTSTSTSTTSTSTTSTSTTSTTSSTTTVAPTTTSTTVATTTTVPPNGATTTTPGPAG